VRQNPQIIARDKRAGSIAADETGRIVIGLYGKEAPESVEVFLQLIKGSLVAPCMDEEDAGQSYIQTSTNQARPPRRDRCARALSRPRCRQLTCRPRSAPAPSVLGSAGRLRHEREDAAHQAPDPAAVQGRRGRSSARPAVASSLTPSSNRTPHFLATARPSPRPPSSAAPPALRAARSARRPTAGGPPPPRRAHSASPPSRRPLPSRRPPPSRRGATGARGR
jgi:hypothetical protein